MSRDPNVILIVLTPSAIADDALMAIKQMVIAGGEVNAETLPGLVTRALTLAYAEIGEGMVGVSAIKRPNNSYRDGVFTKAGAMQDPTK